VLKEKTITWIILFISFSILFPTKTHAILPLDVVFNFTTLFVQVFSFAFIIFITIVFTIKTALKKFFSFGLIKISILFIFISILAYGFYEYKKNNNIDFLNSNFQYFYTQTPEEYLEQRKERNRQDLTAKELNIEGFKSMLESEQELIIFDVREENEYNKGHIINAILWKEDRKLDLEHMEKIAESIDDEIPVVFYCNFGSSSFGIGSNFQEFHNNTYIVNDTSLRWLEEFYLLFSEDDDKWSFYDINKINNEEQFLNSIASGAMLLDPRPKEEYLKHHFVNSENIPITQLKYDTFINRIEELSPENGVTIICFDRKSCDEAYLLSYIIDVWSNKHFTFTWGTYSLSK